jgi:hypothetical protein
MKSALLGAALAGLFFASPASATTINFDDLGGYETPISNGYAGLNWNNWFVLDGTGFEPSGYVNGVVSKENVAYNAYGDPATFSAQKGSFTLNSFYLTAAWNNNLDVTVRGYDAANALVDKASFQVSTSGPTLERFNWTNLASVTLSTSGGVPAGYNGGGTHVALDNLTINSSVSGVPEASTWVMMLAGFAGLGFVGYRRNKAVAVAA